STFEAVRARKAEARAHAGESLARRAQADENQQRVAAHRSLYKSLVNEARETRLARQVGYRDRVFALLQQAKALDVPEKNLVDLKQEAIACMGDFVGLTPITLADFPTNISSVLTSSSLAPSGKLAAFGLTDGAIQLCELPSGRKFDQLRVTHGYI